MLIEPQEELFLDNRLDRFDLWQKLGLSQDVDDRFTVAVFAGSRAGKISTAFLARGFIAALLSGRSARIVEDLAALRAELVLHERKLSPFEVAAYQLGQAMAQEGWRLIYGAGPSGVMGAAADGMLAADASADVFGITLEMFLSKGGNANEGLHPRIRGNFATKQLSQRKWAMFALSDAFVSLPGGFGTLDEAFEAITLEQLKLHRKQHFFLNAFGFYDGLQNFLKGSIVEQGFAGAEHPALIRVVETRDVLMQNLYAAHSLRVCARLCDELWAEQRNVAPQEMREALVKFFGVHDVCSLSRAISSFIKKERHFTKLAEAVRQV